MGIPGGLLPRVLGQGLETLPYISSRSLGGNIRTAKPAVVNSGLFAIRKYFENPNVDGLANLKANMDQLYDGAMDASHSSQERYFCFELARTISSLFSISSGYDITKGDLKSASLQSVINSERKSVLQQELGSACAYSKYSDDKGTVIGAGLSAPAVVFEEILGKGKLPKELQELESARRPTDCALNSEELLAITDYVHPHTGTFEAAVQAGRLNYLGFPDLRDNLNFFIGPLESGVEKLANDPRFSSDKCVLYKGISNQAYGQKEHIAQALQRSMTHGTPYMLPHVVSSTSLKSGAYNNRVGYDLRFEFDHVKSADVACFNMDCIKSQEVLIPFQSAGFKVTSMGVDTVMEYCTHNGAPADRGIEKEIQVVRFRENS